MKLTLEYKPCEHTRQYPTGESYEDYAAGSPFEVKVFWFECHDCGDEIGQRASYL